ncbi:unnamed protein product [Amoebophrya sp. A25]|nr:unnamed protein product [Amoebophrya sp. A25]|eukprot:GSA25T00020797001.1
MDVEHPSSPLREAEEELSDLSDNDALLEQVLPLQNRWALWTRLQAGAFDSKNFEDTQWQKVAKFDTVEKFQAILQHVNPPSAFVAGVFQTLNDNLLGGGGANEDIMDGSSRVGGKYVDAVAYFKEGCFPVVTSEQCRARWDARLKAKQTLPLEVDAMWVDAVANMVGEQFSHSDDVLGLLIAPRERSVVKIELWLRTAEEAACRRIGAKFSKILRKASADFYRKTGEKQRTPWNDVVKCLCLQDEKRRVLYRHPIKEQVEEQGAENEN